MNSYRLSSAAILMILTPSIIANSPSAKTDSVSKIATERPTSDLLDHKATDEVIARARSILEDDLVDYSRAKIRGMHLVEATLDEKARRALYLPVGTKLTAFCGEINAPNRMGGMTGWQKTAIIVEGRDADPLINENDDLSGYYAICPMHPAVVQDLSAALQPKSD